MHIIWETDRWLQKYCASNPGNIKDLETNVAASQSPTDAVLYHEALTLNFTKISSLVRIFYVKKLPFLFSIKLICCLCDFKCASNTWTSYDFFDMGLE